MKMKLICLLAMIFTSTLFYGQQTPDKAVTTGPENGSLIVAGGGLLGPEITKKFITLAGGEDALIVVIPTAAGGEIDMDNNWFVK